MSEESDSDNRHNQRLNLSFDISLPEQNGKTINISATGVYFEVITDNIDAYTQDQSFPSKYQLLMLTRELSI